MDSSSANICVQPPQKGRLKFVLFVECAEFVIVCFAACLVHVRVDGCVEVVKDLIISVEIRKLCLRAHTFCRAADTACVELLIDTIFNESAIDNS
jgi:hypothetical protein